MTCGDRITKVAILLSIPIVGALAGCHGSAPEPPATDRKRAEAVAEKPAPAPSTSDRDAVEVAARGFLKALKDRDTHAAAAFLTARARPAFTKSVGPDRSSGPMLGATYQLGEPAITGDTAQVPVTLREAGKEQKSALKLRRDGGKWGVFAQSGCIIPDDPSSEIVMNFEEPEAILGQILGGKPEDLGKAMEKNFKDSIDRAEKDFLAGKPESRDLAVESLESISRDRFDASWKVDFTSRGRPAGDVLKDLARAMGRSLETTAILDRALARTVAIEVRGLSRYQAIEAVTRPVGLAPFYPPPVTSFDPSTGQNSALATMRLRPRRGPSVVSFAGPFLVELEEVKEDVPYATATLSLKLAASGLPRVVLDELKQGHRDAFTVTDAVDARGRSLLDTPAAASTGGSWIGPPPGEYERRVQVPLKGLVRDVSTVKALRCKLSVSLPVRVETIRFDTLAPGETRKAGDIEATLKTASKAPMGFNGRQGESWNLSIDLRHKPDRAKQGEPPGKARPPFDGIGPDRVKLVGHDAQGKPVRTTLSTSFPSNSSGWTYNLNIQGPATSLVARVITDVKTVDYDVQLHDIPLASHASMPERIEPASFAGHESPVAVEFLAIGGKAPFQTAQLRVINHSNKDIRMLGMKLDYLAPDGRRLGGWNRQDQWGKPWRAGKDPGEPNPILVARGSRSDCEINAPFLTEGTKTIAVTVRTVRFADAETWTAPGVTKK